ncbi:MAG: hypothetical protein AABP62_14870 [Planctomycetota bacterium]
MARVVTAGVPDLPLPNPQQAWVIVELGWEHNDEFTSAEGEYPRTQLFFDKALADAECQRLCTAFFAAETPIEFEVDFAAYRDEAEHHSFDELAVTWEGLRASGFPDPYYVLELGANELGGAS